MQGLGMYNPLQLSVTRIFPREGQAHRRPGQSPAETREGILRNERAAAAAMEGESRAAAAPLLPAAAKCYPMTTGSFHMHLIS